MPVMIEKRPTTTDSYACDNNVNGCSTGSRTTEDAHNAIEVVELSVPSTRQVRVVLLVRAHPLNRRASCDRSLAADGTPVP